MSLLGLTEKKPYLDNFVSIDLKIFLRIFLILVSLSSFGQEKRKIIIKKAPFFEKDKINFPDASLLTRNDKDQVLISHDGIMLYCNKAYFYENKNFVEAFGNVVLNLHLPKGMSHSKNPNQYYIQTHFFLTEIYNRCIIKTEVN